MVSLAVSRNPVQEREPLSGPQVYTAQEQQIGAELTPLNETSLSTQLALQDLEQESLNPLLEVHQPDPNTSTSDDPFTELELPDSSVVGDAISGVARGVETVASGFIDALRRDPEQLEETLNRIEELQEEQVRISAADLVQPASHLDGIALVEAHQKRIEILRQDDELLNGVVKLQGAQPLPSIPSNYRIRELSAQLEEAPTVVGRIERADSLRNAA